MMIISRSHQRFFNCLALDTLATRRSICLARSWRETAVGFRTRCHSPFAALVHVHYAQVLAVDCDLSAVHQALQATRLPTRNGLDQLAHRALALTRERSPAALATLGGFRLPGECAASAFPFPYMQQSAQAQDRLAQAAAASTSDSTPSNKRAAPAPHSVPPSTPRPPRMPCTLRDKPQLQQLRCAIRPFPCRATHVLAEKSPARVHVCVPPILSCVSVSLSLFSEGDKWTAGGNVYVAGAHAGYAATARGRSP